MSDEYDWYFKALGLGGGRQLTRDQQQALGVTHEPQAGFYRKRNKHGADVPVAIWTGENGLVAVAGNEAADPIEIWTWVCSWPVREEVWRDVAENGKVWPDDAPVAEAKPGHNLPDDPHEALALEFEAERELADKFLGKEITTQAQADQAAVWAKKLAAIAKKATDLHKVEKQPSLDECRRIDDKWRDLKEGPADYSKRLKRHLDVFLLNEQRKERERQETARREEERLRLEAEEAAKAAAPDDTEAQAEAERLAQEAAAKAKEAEARNANAGRTGARVALRTFVSAQVTDYHAAAKALLDANHREFKETIDQLANRAVRAGVTLAGVERVEEQRAA